MYNVETKPQIGALDMHVFDVKSPIIFQPWKGDRVGFDSKAGPTLWEVDEMMYSAREGCNWALH